MLQSICRAGTSLQKSTQVQLRFHWIYWLEQKFRESSQSERCKEKSGYEYDFQDGQGRDRKVKTLMAIAVVIGHVMWLAARASNGMSCDSLRVPVIAFFPNFHRLPAEDTCFGPGRLQVLTLVHQIRLECCLRRTESLRKRPVRSLKRQMQCPCLWCLYVRAFGIIATRVDATNM